MSETWGAAFVRALFIALWLVALAVVSIASVFIGSEWRTNVAAFEADLDPRQRADMEEFPPGQDNVAERVARAREGLAWVNRRFAVNGGICAAFGAVLIGGAFVYWRRSRHAGRPRRRTWILALPLAAALAVLVVIWLSMILAGSIRG
jgi:hypothetical protein